MGGCPQYTVALPQEVVECPAGASLPHLLVQVRLCMWSVLSHLVNLVYATVFNLYLILKANGTAGSQLSTPRSGKSPSPSPTSPASLRRRQVKKQKQKWSNVLCCAKIEEFKEVFNLIRQNFKCFNRYCTDMEQNKSLELYWWKGFVEVFHHPCSSKKCVSLTTY